MILCFQNDHPYFSLISNVLDKVYQSCFFFFLEGYVKIHYFLASLWNRNSDCQVTSVTSNVLQWWASISQTRPTKVGSVLFLKAFFWWLWSVRERSFQKEAGGRTKPGRELQSVLGRWPSAMSPRVLPFLTNNWLSDENSGENSTLSTLCTSKALLLSANTMKKNIHLLGSTH